MIEVPPDAGEGAAGRLGPMILRNEDITEIVLEAAKSGYAGWQLLEADQ